MMAQDVEVAPSFQPLLGLAANFLRSHESQVADPMIEAAQRIAPAAELAVVSTPPMLVEIVPDFSVVRFRPNFMLVSEKNRMKSHKNQWL